MHAFGKGLAGDLSWISAPNCLSPVNDPSTTGPLIFTHDRFTELGYAGGFDDCRNSHFAFAGAVEPLAAS
jgi:hypothetical protein